MPPDPMGQHLMDPRFLTAGPQLGADLENQQQTTIISCPKKMVGRVIGKNGETIKALQNYTGAQIQIDQRLDPTRVSIAGPAKNLQTAQSMVLDIVAGTFKGFAMLRAFANTTRSGPGAEILSPQAPTYIKGYGFVPPPQMGDPVDMGSGLQLADMNSLQYPGYQPNYQNAVPLVHPSMYDPQGYSQLSAAIAQAQMMVPGQSPAVNGVGPRMQLGMHHGMPQAMPVQHLAAPQVGPTPAYGVPSVPNYGLRADAADPNSLASQFGALSLRPDNLNGSEGLPIPTSTTMQVQTTSSHYQTGSVPANFQF